MMARKGTMTDQLHSVEPGAEFLDCVAPSKLHEKSNLGDKK